jgi:hypothetical protein
MMLTPRIIGDWMTTTYRCMLCDFTGTTKNELDWHNAAAHGKSPDVCTREEREDH